MNIQQQTMFAMSQNGINSILFRNALAKNLGLNVTESMTLSLLGIKGISTPSELAKYTGLTTGSTTTMLDRLEKKKFIKRKSNPNDRRGVIIEIDEEYAKRAQSLVAGIQKSQKELIAQYSDEELKIVIDFLNKFTSNVIKHTEEIEKVS